MANLTTYEHFIGEINIPINSASGPDAEALELFIAKYEGKLLSGVLGYKLASTLLAAFNTDPQPTTGVLFDLWNGKDYIDKHGRENHWPGFITIGQNLIANFIYCKWQADSNTFTTGNGEQKSKFTNSVNASPDAKTVRAWNEMVEMLLVMDDFICQNIADYPDYIGRSVWWDTYTNNGYYTTTNELGF